MKILVFYLILGALVSTYAISNTLDELQIKLSSQDPDYYQYSLDDTNIYYLEVVFNKNANGGVCKAIE